MRLSKYFKIAEASKTFYEVVENDLITNDELSQGYYIKSEFYYKDSDDYTMYTEKVSDNVLITTVSLGLSAFCEILAIIMLEGSPIEIVHDSATYGKITEIAELKGNLKNKEQELEELEGVKSNGRKKR